MMKNHNLFLFFIILFIAVISGCVQPQTTNMCVNDLNALENYFNLSKTNVKILNSECATCNPWYIPEVAKFNSTIEHNGDRYLLSFSSNCPRHETALIKYCISSENKDEFYANMKKKICSSIEYFNPEEGKILCDPEVKYGVVDIDSFAQCLKDFKLTEGINFSKGKEFCSSQCDAGNSNCAITCFEEYVKNIRANLSDEWCDQFETNNGGKVIFSVEYPASSNDWDKTKRGIDC